MLLVMDAKRGELSEMGICNASDEDVLRAISRKEMALHCRRGTRGTEETTKLLEDTIALFLSESGCDLLGAPLLDSVKIKSMCESQKHHVACLQDPADYPLYTVTGSVSKGGVSLPTYRCARGSTSLESFQLHLNRFIPGMYVGIQLIGSMVIQKSFECILFITGTTANALNFQAYLLEGLARWNENRASQWKASQPRSYSHLLRCPVNQLRELRLDKPLCPQYRFIPQYTGKTG